MTKKILGIFLILWIPVLCIGLFVWWGQGFDALLMIFAYLGLASAGIIFVVVGFILITEGSIITSPGKTSESAHTLDE